MAVYDAGHVRSVLKDILKKFIDENVTAGDKGACDAKWLAVIQQLSEIGWSNVIELDQDFKTVSIRLSDPEDPKLNLSIPNDFPKRPPTVESGFQFSFPPG